MAKEIEKGGEKENGGEIKGYSIDHVRSLRAEDNRIPLFATFFLILGGGLFIFGVIYYMVIDDFIQHASSAQGTVKNAVVVFKTSSMETVEFDSLYVNYLSQNQNVTVLYNPKDPLDAKIKLFFPLWIIPLLSWIIGLLCILVGSWDFIKHRFRRR